MSWRTSSAVVRFRDLTRSIGLNSLIANILQKNKSYEERYESRFLSRVQAGDVVWDVGANQGLYSNLFSKIVGSSGMVVAFEPSPSNFNELICKCTHNKNIDFYNFGLGLKNKRVNFVQGLDDLGATSMVELSKDGQTNDSVEIFSGDFLVLERGVAAPSVIKIDVEGYELEVLEGMKNLILKSSTLRVIGVEVHFTLLRLRGYKNAAKIIEEMLSKNGFTTEWSDSSHLIAVRSN